MNFIRCPSCNKNIVYIDFKEYEKLGYDKEEILDIHKIELPCCRMNISTTQTEISVNN